MNILVTAGNTQTPLDRVRCITNIFTGRTGAHVALTARDRGHRVCLLTSHPEVIEELAGSHPSCGSRWRVRTYRTIDDLHRLMAEEVPHGAFDAIIHAAAVSDYSLAGVFTPAPGTTFEPSISVWKTEAGRLDSGTPRRARSRAFTRSRGSASFPRPSSWIPSAAPGDFLASW